LGTDWGLPLGIPEGALENAFNKYSHRIGRFGWDMGLTG
jgi:hypothetical protein